MKKSTVFKYILPLIVVSSIVHLQAANQPATTLEKLERTTQQFVASLKEYRNCLTRRVPCTQAQKKNLKRLAGTIALLTATAVTTALFRKKSSREPLSMESHEEPPLSFEQLRENYGTDTINKNFLANAVENGDVERVKTLLEGEIDPNFVDSDNLIPLHHAITKGTTEMATLLLNNGADPNVSTRPLLKTTPLMEAPTLEKFKLLLQFKANPDQKDAAGKTVDEYVKDKPNASEFSDALRAARKSDKGE